MREAKIIEIFEEGQYSSDDTTPDKAKRIYIYTDENDGYGYRLSYAFRSINEISIDRFISKLSFLLVGRYKISIAYIEENEYSKNGTKSIFGE